jgi:lysyl-tRNA synthetase class 2
MLEESHNQTISKSERILRLEDRAAMFVEVRSFFADRGVIEVDCPIISSRASVDTHIDLMPVRYYGAEIRYLHSSPEFGMKRLLSEGIGDIFQMSHVFRDGEYGPKHNPEFMLVEWYRLGMSFMDMIQETCDFVQLFIGKYPIRHISYREAFLRYVGFDYIDMDTLKLAETLREKGIDVPLEVEDEGKDAVLNIALGSLIEPNLGLDELTVLYYYPSSQAALAQTCMRDGESVAERFEVYFRGVELSNGYHELADPEEQLRRFDDANQQRHDLGKDRLPIDDYFIEALEKGLPDCCGVAVGFDRLMMLRHSVDSLDKVLPFDWNKA